jgi:hypothetical protein
MQLTGSSSKMQVFRDSNKLTQMTKFHTLINTSCLLICYEKDIGQQR